MPRPTGMRLLRGMWTNRPSLLDLLFLTVTVLIARWFTHGPLVLLALAVALIVIGSTIQMAIADLRKAQRAPGVSPTEGGDHAED